MQVKEWLGEPLSRHFLVSVDIVTSRGKES